MLTVVLSRTIIPFVTWRIIMKNLNKIREDFNNLYKKSDKVFHELAVHYNLSDTSMWILYIIRETNYLLSQNEISEILHLSKQTINTPLKQLESDGYIKLKQSNEDRRVKVIELTESGVKLCSDTVDNIINIETEAFEVLSNEEAEQLLFLYNRVVNELINRSRKLINEDLYEN